jgi:hypothetical protein
VFLIVAGFVGCGTGPSDPAADKSSEAGRKKFEAEVTKAFADLQAAAQAKDADKLWDLIDKTTQDNAEAEAKRVKQVYANLAANDKMGYEKKLGLSAQELAEPSGKLYLKSIPFYSQALAKIPGSTIDKLEHTAVQTAIVYYGQPGGSVSKLDLFHQHSGWKFVVPVPKAPAE